MPKCSTAGPYSVGAVLLICWSLIFVTDLVSQDQQPSSTPGMPPALGGLPVEVDALGEGLTLGSVWADVVDLFGMPIFYRGVASVDQYVDPDNPDNTHVHYLDRDGSMAAGFNRSTTAGTTLIHTLANQGYSFLFVCGPATDDKTCLLENSETVVFWAIREGAIAIWLKLKE